MQNNQLTSYFKGYFYVIFSCQIKFKKIEFLASGKKRCLRFDSGALILVNKNLRNRCLRLLGKLGYHFCAFNNAIKKL